MRVAVRADSGTHMGTGHIMRSLTLVSWLRKATPDLDAVFICRDYPGQLGERIINHGFHLKLLPRPRADHAGTAENWLGENEEVDAEQTRQAINEVFPKPVDWLIVDHYGVTMTWETQIRPFVSKVLVIDDLADRQHDCDLLVNQTLGASLTAYTSLVPQGCKILVGSKYAMLREEFSLPKNAAMLLRQQQWPPKNILISLGGADPSNITLEVVQAISVVAPQLQQTIIAGPAFMHTRSLESYCNEREDLCLLKSPEYMAQLMLSHGLAVGAAGSSSWERCALGLPTFAVVLADNQMAIASALQRVGAARLLETPSNRDILATNIQRWLTDKANYMGSVKAAMSVCDGRGASRVTEAILEQ